MFNLETISPKMLDYYVGKAGVIIIDLRTKEEYMQGHIKGAINIPYDEQEWCVAPPKADEIVLYCERGSISLVVGRELAKRGYQVRSVIGGIHAYNGRYLVISSYS